MKLSSAPSILKHGAPPRRMTWYGNLVFDIVRCFLSLLVGSWLWETICQVLMGVPPVPTAGKPMRELAEASVAIKSTSVSCNQFLYRIKTDEIWKCKWQQVWGNVFTILDYEFETPTILFSAMINSLLPKNTTIASNVDAEQLLIMEIIWRRPRCALVM